MVGKFIIFCACTISLLSWTSDDKIPEEIFNKKLLHSIALLPKKKNVDDTVITVHIPDANIGKQCFELLPEDIFRPIVIKAILTSPENAGRLSCVSTVWNAYINSSDMTEYLIQTYFYYCRYHLNTRGRKEKYPYPFAPIKLYEEVTPESGINTCTYI